MVLYGRLKTRIAVWNFDVGESFINGSVLLCANEAPNEKQGEYQSQLMLIKRIIYLFFDTTK